MPEESELLKTVKFSVGISIGLELVNTLEKLNDYQRLEAVEYLKLLKEKPDRPTEIEKYKRILNIINTHFKIDFTTKDEMDSLQICVDTIDLIKQIIEVK